MPDWNSWGIVILASALVRQNSVAQIKNIFFIKSCIDVAKVTNLFVEMAKIAHFLAR
jgi:hypothetical protein